MKQYFGALRQKVSSHFQGACAQCVEECDGESKSEIQDLKRQIAELQTQLSRIAPKDNRTHSKKAPIKSATAKPSADSSKPHKEQPSNVDGKNNHSDKPTPWYCFRCGEDGHIRPQCEAEPNPSLLASKRKLLREKQLAWEIKNGPPPANQLN